MSDSDIKTLLVASTKDPASSRIARHILDRWKFIQNDGIYSRNNFLLTYIDSIHLNHDNIINDPELKSSRIGTVVFLSKHSSSAQIKSMTVHPTGNFGPNDLGGYPGTLTPAAPEMMSQALRIMRNRYNGDRFMTTFEATHHGPYLEAENFYIEIGTTSDEWEDESALDSVSSAIMDNRGNTYPNFVGIGGGHYVPKITEYVVDNRINVGHLISKHNHEAITESQLMDAVARTRDCKGFIVDKKGTRGRVREMLRSIVAATGLEVILL